MKFWTAPLFLLLCAQVSIGAEPYQPPTAAVADAQPLAPDAVKRAMEMLTSPNASVRSKAAVALRQRSTNEACKAQAMDIFKGAQAKQKQVLEAIVKKGVPALSKIKVSYDAWVAKRSEVMPLILTDYHKDPEKVAMLTREHDATEKLRKALDKELSSAEAAYKPLTDATAPMEQLDHEIALLDGPTAGYVAKKPEAYLKEFGAATELLQVWAAVTERQAVAAEQAAVLKHNESCKWAPKSSIAFAAIINAKRATMNLEPLRLDERLSLAATDHSKEMIAMGYFAHESPVEANKSPGDRARNANFDGGWSGENIFMGNAGAGEAYGAWWGSDGHRFIMFANGPNTLGLGPVGVHWTLMTGKKTWPQ